MQWGLFFFCAVVVMFGLSLTRRMVIRRLSQIAHHTETDWDDLILNLLRGTRSFVIFVISVYFASLFLERNAKIEQISRSVFVLVCLFQVGVWGMTLIEFALQRVIRLRSRETGEVDSALATTLPTIRFFASIFLYSLLVLLALDNLGVNVTALLAGLGVGGIAVALAAQNILGDIFASLSIVIDKPFVVGDLITVGQHQGTVEKIGLKTTRLRSVTGEQLIVSNADMLQSRIQNFKRMQERRVSFSLGVAYETNRSALERIPEWIKDIIHSQQDARFERCHLKALGASSIDFEIIYWVKTSDVQRYMNTHQSIQLDILRIFEQEKIVIAYPTQKVFVRSEVGVNV